MLSRLNLFINICQNESVTSCNVSGGWLAGVCNTLQCMDIGKVSHLMDVIIVHGRILYAKRKNDLLFGR